jgi:thiol-disulfide isomerase/thioredoxin
LKRTLKFSYLVFVFFACSLLFGCKPDAVDSYGRPIRMSDYKGKWVVISYWATWCPTCIREIPELIKLKTYYPQVIILGVNPDNLDNKVLRDFAEEYDVNYPFLSHFPIEDWSGKTTSELPVTYIISPEGKLYQTLLGPQTLANFQSVMHLPPVTYN